MLSGLQPHLLHWERPSQRTLLILGWVVSFSELLHRKGPTSTCWPWQSLTHRWSFWRARPARNSASIRKAGSGLYGAGSWIAFPSVHDKSLKMAEPSFTKFSRARVSFSVSYRVHAPDLWHGAADTVWWRLPRPQKRTEPALAACAPHDPQMPESPAQGLAKRHISCSNCDTSGSQQVLQGPQDLPVSMLSEEWAEEIRGDHGIPFV